MHRVFGNEGGFEDRELRMIQSALKQRTRREPSLPEVNKRPTPSGPSPRVSQEKAA